ncbi:MAG TPA: hypothetical protein VFE24_11410 [Pirellulales bacterium]|nr:hypothetical protein [Pirellulales bacterium]
MPQLTGSLAPEPEICPRVSPPEKVAVPREPVRMAAAAMADEDPFEPQFERPVPIAAPFQPVLELPPAPTEIAFRPSVQEPSPSEVRPAQLAPPRLESAPAVEISSTETSATDPFAARLPKSLLWQLESIGASPLAGGWARAIADRIHALTQQPTSGGAENARLLGELRRLSYQAEGAAAGIHDPALIAAIRRAQYALQRRLDVWERVYRGYLPSSPEAVVHATDQERFGASVAQLETTKQMTGEGRPLREFLLLDTIRNAARPDTTDALPAVRRQLARRVLARLNQLKIPADRLSPSDDLALTTLSDELRYWAAEPVCADQVLVQVEQFEEQGTSAAAQVLGALARRLVLSPDPQSQEVGQQLAAHYRNANVRLVVSEKLLNRLVPESTTTTGDVQDTILGVPVAGCSTTTTRLAIKLLPDPTYLRMQIDAQGTVNSNTVSSSGPATFHNQGESNYAAKKIVRFGPDGVRVQHAAADANTNSELQSMETSYDGIPLVSSLVRNYARTQYDRNQSEAKVEVEDKVASRAQAQIDAEVDARLARAEKQFKTRVVQRLQKLELDPQIASLSTSEQRAAIRLRLAGDEQLAAFTPRPQASSDSWASLQIHQSAINNALVNLRLEGKTFTPAELAVYLADRLEMPKLAAKKAELPDDVTIEFAAQDAIVVRCAEGLLTIDVSIAELSHEKNHFSNFTARVHYRPAPSGLQAGFGRDGTIELIGNHLNTRSQIALRGVISKLFARDKPLQLLPESWAADPRLKDLSVSQLVVEDGWIGLALAPKGTPAGTPTLEAQRPPHNTSPRDY